MRPKPSWPHRIGPICRRRSRVENLGGPDRRKPSGIYRRPGDRTGAPAGEYGAVKCLSHRRSHAVRTFAQHFLASSSCEILVTGGVRLPRFKYCGISILKRARRSSWPMRLFRQGGESNRQWLLDQVRAGTADFAPYRSRGGDSQSPTSFAHGPFDYICHLGGQVAMTTSLSDPRRDLR